MGSSRGFLCMEDESRFLSLCEWWWRKEYWEDLLCLTYFNRICIRLFSSFSSFWCIVLCWWGHIWGRMVCWGFLLFISCIFRFSLSVSSFQYIWLSKLFYWLSIFIFSSLRYKFYIKYKNISIRSYRISWKSSVSKLL